MSSLVLPSLARFLASHADVLIERWIERVRAGVDSAGHSQVELRDHIPRVVRDLTESLDRGACRPFVRAADDAPSEHGRQRFRLGFDIEQLVAEYSLLHTVILDAAGAEEVPLHGEDVRVLIDFFAKAVAEGVAEHERARVRDAELAREVASALQSDLLAHQALARAEAEAERAKLHALFEQAPVAICITEGAAHVFTFANAAYRALAENQHAVGMTLLDVLPDGGHGIGRIFDDVMRTGVTHVEEAQQLALSGREQPSWYSFVVTPHRDAAGHTTGVMQCATDVTELVTARLRVEQLVRQAEDREAELRLVTDALPVLVSFVDAEERYGFVNKHYEEWFGIPVSELRGRKVRDVIGEAAYAQLGPLVQRALSGDSFEVEQQSVPYRLGGARDVHISFRPLVSGGHRSGYVALLEDVTERRRSDREREALAIQGSDVLEAMGDAFFCVDSAWTVVLVNERYERASRRSREEMLGGNFWELFLDARDPMSLYFQSYHECMDRRVPVQFVDYYKSLDRWTEVRAYPTSAGGISVFFRDVTQEKRAEHALRDQAKLEQQLLGIASHDLRNPLNVIGLASSILMSSGRLGEQELKTATRIKSAADRATTMVRDLLDFTQARIGGGIRIEPRPVALRAIVAPVVEEVAAANPTREISLTSEGNDEGVWDASRLGQVVQNLVSNAVKYSFPDTPIAVRSWAHGNEVSLSVHNHGAPIPPEQLADIFEPFQRGGQLEQASRSVGLGLYIVREVVMAHHGKVGVTSTPEDGTTFTVTLPANADDARSR